MKLSALFLSFLFSVSAFGNDGCFSFGLGSDFGFCLLNSQQKNGGDIIVVTYGPANYDFSDKITRSFYRLELSEKTSETIKLDSKRTSSSIQIKFEDENFSAGDFYINDRKVSSYKRLNDESIEFKLEQIYSDASEDVEIELRSF